MSHKFPPIAEFFDKLGEAAQVLEQPLDHLEYILRTFGRAPKLQPAHATVRILFTNQVTYIAAVPTLVPLYEKECVRIWNLGITTKHPLFVSEDGRLLYGRKDTGEYDTTYSAVELAPSLLMIDSYTAEDIERIAGAIEQLMSS